MDEKVLVSVAMPNEKDLEIMEETVMTLKSFGIPYDLGGIRGNNILPTVLLNKCLNILRTQAIEASKLLYQQQVELLISHLFKYDFSLLL